MRRHTDCSVCLLYTSYPPLGSKQAIKIQKQELEPDIDKIIEDLSEDCKEISSKDCKEVLVRLKDEKAVEDEFLNSFIDGLRYSIEEGDKVFLEANIMQLKHIKMCIRDSANGVEIDIPPYMRLKDGDFDPIEIYAYYLGMFINNMDCLLYTSKRF